MSEFLALTPFAGLLIFAACCDVTTMKIPNWVSIALAGSFPVVALLLNMPLIEIGWHLAFGFAILVVCFILFQLEWMGGGDAKLIAAASVWTGVAAFGPFALTTVLAGGLMALVLLVARKNMQPSETRAAFINRLLKPYGGVPYGVAIMAGGLVTLQTLTLTTPLTLP